MSLRPALSIAAVAVLSLAACAARPTRAGSPSPRPAPAVAASPAHPDGQAGADAPAPAVAASPAHPDGQAGADAPAPPAAADEGMRRFDAMMRRGGALYELAPTEAGALACERWSVHPPDRRSPAGGLERIRRDDRTITTTTFGYEWSPTGTELGRGPEITLFGPYSFVEGPEGTRGKGRACATMVEVSGVNRDVVLMGGNHMYLTQDACEGAHQTILARLRGLPPDGGTPAELMAALAGGGMPGC